MRRVLILAIPAVLVLGACSSDDDDEPEVTLPDVTLPDVTLPDVTLPDVTLPDITLPDITLPDITLPDLTLPDFSIPENAEETARDMLEGLGLDDTQIDCLVDRIEEVGGNADQLNDIMGLLGDCDISISDLQPGG